jgi:hypothetical protein
MKLSSPGSLNIGSIAMRHGAGLRASLSAAIDPHDPISAEDFALTLAGLAARQR